MTSSSRRTHTCTLKLGARRSVLGWDHDFEFQQPHLVQVVPAINNTVLVLGMSKEPIQIWEVYTPTIYYCIYEVKDGYIAII